MDKSFIELLKTVGNQIDHTELNAAIKADNFGGEFALSEDGLISAKEQVGKLLSMESAINNPTVIERINKDSYPKHMKTIMTKFEDKLKPVMDKLGIDYADTEFISDKIGDIEEKLSTALASGDNKDVINSLNEELRVARELPSKLEEEFNIKIQEKDREYEAKELYKTFLIKASERQWGDAYSIPGLKEDALKGMYNRLSAKAHLKLSEDGSIQLFQKDMPDKELYNGNKLETFQSLLEPELEPYLKKSTPENVRTEQVGGKPPKALNAQEARNLKEQEAQKRMYA